VTMDVGMSTVRHILSTTKFSPVVQGFFSSQRSEEDPLDDAPSSPYILFPPSSASHSSLLLSCCLTGVPGELSCKESERNMSWFLPGLGLCLVLVQVTPGLAQAELWWGCNTQQGGLCREENTERTAEVHWVW
jgi:hypothetical protein